MKKQPFGKNNESVIDIIIKKIRLLKIKKHIPDNSIVIDLGCGYKGDLLKIVSNKIKIGIGYDLEICKDNLPPNVNLKKAELNENIDYPKNTVDVVTALAIIEHIYNPQKFCREIYKLLKPGGKLLITTPSLQSQKLLEFMANYLKIISHQEISDHKRYYTSRTLFQELVLAGFNKNNIQIKYFEFGLNLFAEAIK